MSAADAPSAAVTIDALEPPRDGELVVVVGPTASGKTALAIALAERWNGEVIGVDSVQVYRRFDIGSGKPTAESTAPSTSSSQNSPNESTWKGT